MKITDKKYFETYRDEFGVLLNQRVARLDFNASQIDIDYFTQASAVFSSNIEGNSIDLNSFMNYKLSQKKFESTKEVEEIVNLINAYKYAQANNLNEANLLECHHIFSRTLLIKSARGTYRNDRVGFFGETGLIYLAIEPEYVVERMREFFKDISFLLKHEHTIEEVFYFASLIHLIFVHIHPFMDGNGRTARILEKWFLAEKLGSEFWKIPSEKYYRDNQDQYYTNINLGVNYYELNYDLCMPFLLMLPDCLK